MMNEIRTTQANPSPGMIDFGIGQPGLDLLPLDFIRRAAAMRLGAGDAGLLNYGYELGDGYFRQQLAHFLENGYGFPVGADSLMVTAGASQGLDLICTRFTKPGDLVVVAEPTYFLALRIFADHHLRVAGVPVDDDGLIVEALVDRLQDEQPALLYTVPAFQNPTGLTLSPARRKRLLELSRAYDFLVVADEVYQLLDYDNAPPLPMAHFVEGERVLSLGSFSKILAPGLRLGWVQAGPVLLQRLASSGLVDSGGGLNPFTSNVVRVVLEEGWQDAHLAHLKAVYRRRVAAMDHALRRHMDHLCSFRRPEGGFFYWLELDKGLDTAELLAAAQEANVGFQPGIRFSSQNGLGHKLRLSFAFYGEADIEEGIERLATVVAAQ
jgi:DNA-binding transcriptional MocR family regulator